MNKRFRKVLIVGLVTAVMFVGFAPSALAGPGEGSFLASMNAERVARGLAPLEMYWDLRDDARAHSATMQSEDALRHNPGLGSVTSGWITLGENVGVGPDVSTIQAAFMASATHRGNILGDYNYVGVGTAQADGKMWVTVVFMKGPPGLVTPVEPEPAPEPPPEEQPEPQPEPTPKPPPATTSNPGTVQTVSTGHTQRSAVVSVEVQLPVRSYGRTPGLRPYHV